MSVSEFIQQFYHRKDSDSIKSNKWDFMPFYFSLLRFVQWFIEIKLCSKLKKIKVEKLTILFSFVVCVVFISVVVYTGFLHPLACVVMILYFISYYIFNFERRLMFGGVKSRSNLAAIITVI